MILESKYQLYLKNGDKEMIVVIYMGKVHFDRNVVVNLNNQGETRIERTDNKVRERPNAHQRHSTNMLLEPNSNMKLVDSRNFEWLAWNYRMHKNEHQYHS